MRAETKSILWIMGLVTLVSAWRHAGSSSPDLLASWMAGLNFARGAFDQIYFGSESVFTMRPPESWVQELRAEGHTGGIYPFIYPPLWAWVASKLSAIGSFQGMVLAGNVLNPILLVGSIFLAARMAARGLGQKHFVFVGVLALGSSATAIVALEQNQPQILVSFLLVLAAERTHSGDNRSAGLALALAASIKLYPAVFAVIWIARRNWRALAAFVLAGSALGLASIGVAGWPLHQAFLHEVSSISNTVLVTFFTHSVDATIADQFFKDQMVFIVGLDKGAVAGWTVLEKPAFWQIGSKAGILLVIAGIYLAARRPIGADPLFWPIAFVALALVSPLSWGYHYLPALVFLPVLLDRFGLRLGLVLLAIILAPTSVVFFQFAHSLWASVAQPAGTAAMAIFLAVLVRSTRTAAPANNEFSKESPVT